MCSPDLNSNMLLSAHSHAYKADVGRQAKTADLMRLDSRHQRRWLDAVRLACLGQLGGQCRKLEIAVELASSAVALRGCSQPRTDLPCCLKRLHKPCSNVNVLHANYKYGICTLMPTRQNSNSQTPTS